MSSQLFQVGGLGYSLPLSEDYPFLERESDWFRPFCRCPPSWDSGDELHLTIEPLDGNESTVGFDRVLEHKGKTHILKGDGVYRIQSYADYVCRELEWTTQFGVGLDRVITRTTELVRENGSTFLPGIGIYPHFRFILPWHLATRDGLWVHCAGAVRNGRFFLLAGRSGRGKSTLARILQDSGHFQVSSDEVNVVRMYRGTITGFGTPWYSSAQLTHNISGPVKGLFFLEHARENCIAPMSKGEALQRMLKQVFLPWFDEPTLQRILSTLETVVQSIPCWTLGFRPDEAVAGSLAEFADGL